MATRKPTINDFKNRWDSPMVSNLKLPNQKKKSTSKKTVSKKKK